MLPNAFTNIDGDQQATADATSIAPNSIFQLPFTLNVADNASIEPYIIPLNLNWNTIFTKGITQTEYASVNLKGKVKLSLSTEDTLNPGQVNTINVKLNNEGTGAASQISVSVTAPAGVSILDQISSISALAANSTCEIPLKIYVSSSSAGAPITFTFPITYNDAYGNSKSSSQSLSFEVQLLNESIVFCQFPGKSAAPGDTIQFQVRLKNPFGVETRFRLSVDSVPSNWTASVKNANGEYVTETTLDSSESVDLVVEVESPESAKIGEEHQLLIKAEPSDGNVASSLPLTIAIIKSKEETKITAKFPFPDVTVEAGKVVQYPITIANLGYVDKLLLLSVKPPTGWEAVFKSGVLEVSRLYMEAGESKDLIIEVTPPSTVNVGAYTISIQVKAETGETYVETELKATIAGSYTLKLETSTLLTSVVTGGSVTFTAKITNTGYTSVTTVGLDVGAPTDWGASIIPTQVESLKPTESSTFTVVLKTAENTVAGDYLITLTGLSDQVESSTVQVRITASASTSWGLIGIGIAAVIIVALVIVFMKFRRR
jgi:uncharacterized membrane protein